MIGLRVSGRQAENPARINPGLAFPVLAGLKLCLEEVQPPACRTVDFLPGPDVSSPDERSRPVKPRYRKMLRKMEAREKKPPAEETTAAWSLYILKCRDGSFYTGVTNDIERRFREHEEGRASRFTRTRRLVVLVYQEKCGSRSQALLRECAVKSLGRQGKEDLVAGGSAPGRSKKQRQ